MSKQSDIVKVSQDAGTTGFVNTSGDTMTGSLVTPYQVINGDVDYIGMSIRNTKANYSTSFIDAQNRTNAADSHIFFHHETDGSSTISFGTQPAGAFTDRRISGRMLINGNGHVLTPYQPAFDAVLTSGAAGVQFGANQRIVFNSTNTNIGNHYDTSTGRFTAPVAGLYMFSCTGMTLSTTWFKLLVNDAPIAYPHNPYETGGGADWASASSTWLISLNASDFVSLHVGSSGVGIYGAGNNHNNFCGYLLG